MTHPIDKSFDEIFKRALNQSIGLDFAFPQQSSQFPPHNILKHSDTEFSVQVALAGYNKENISIDIKKNILTISTKDKVEDGATVEYLYKGIAARAFTKEFTLGEYVEVVGAHMNNGILEVMLVKNIPDEKKPRKIDIA